MKRPGKDWFIPSGSGMAVVVTVGDGSEESTRGLKFNYGMNDLKPIKLHYLTIVKIIQATPPPTKNIASKKYSVLLLHLNVKFPWITV